MLDPTRNKYGQIIVTLNGVPSTHPRTFDDPMIEGCFEWFSKYGIPEHISYRRVSPGLLFALQWVIYDNWIRNDGPNYVRYN